MSTGIHETTGHYWPKQFQVLFDAREMKPLLVDRGEKAVTMKANEGTGEAEGMKKGKG